MRLPRSSGGFFGVLCKVLWHRPVLPRLLSCVSARLRVRWGGWSTVVTGANPTVAGENGRERAFQGVQPCTPCRGRRGGPSGAGRGCWPMPPHPAAPWLDAHGVCEHQGGKYLQGKGRICRARENGHLWRARCQGCSWHHPSSWGCWAGGSVGLSMGQEVSLALPLPTSNATNMGGPTPPAPRLPSPQVFKEMLLPYKSHLLKFPTLQRVPVTSSFQDMRGAVNSRSLPPSPS